VRYRVVRNRGNFNNHIGLPLSLIELRQRPEIAVVELGMNHAGEISTLVRVAEPEVRVWTNVGEAHVGFFARSTRSRMRRPKSSRAPARPRCWSPTPTTRGSSPGRAASAAGP
jgi:UDP-N-acetylmuramyl pentapeptide synthase